MSTLNTPAFSGGGSGTEMLCFELLAPGEDMLNVYSPITISLPVMPRTFKLERIFLTNYDYDTNWWGPNAVDLRIHDKYETDLVNTTAYLEDGVGQIQTQAVLSYPSVLRCSFNYNNQGSPYLGYAQGLVLWLRGTWIN